MFLAQRLAGEQPGYISLALTVPDWLTIVAACILIILAVWQRGSVQRSALLASLTLAVNVALVVCVMGCLWGELARV